MAAPGCAALHHHPLLVAFFHGVRDAHTGTRRSSRLRHIFHLRLRRISVDGDAVQIHVHGAEIDGLQPRQMLTNALADGVVLAGLFLTTGRTENRSKQTSDQPTDKHVPFHKTSSSTNC